MFHDIITHNCINVGSTVIRGITGANEIQVTINHRATIIQVKRPTSRDSFPCHFATTNTTSDALAHQVLMFQVAPRELSIMCPSCLCRFPCLAVNNCWYFNCYQIVFRIARPVRTSFPLAPHPGVSLVFEYLTN